MLDILRQEYLQMTSQWYFADAGKSVGPVSFDEVATKVRMFPDISVWREGLDQWTAARLMPEFVSVLRSSPPPLPPPPLPPVAKAPAIPEPDTAPSGQVHAWRRFFARNFDGLIFAVIISFAVSLFAPGAFSDKHSDRVFSILVLLLYLPVDAILLLLFGRSLGKALYGIRLVPRTRLTGSKAFRRAALVWWRGWGAGIPFVTLFTCLNAHKRLKRTGSTSWDQDLEIDVVHSRLSGLRWLVIALVWIASLSLIIFAASLPD